MMDLNFDAPTYSKPADPDKWKHAKPGDKINGYMVIARNMYPKRRCKAIADAIGGQVWIDSPATWAVMLPVKGRP